MYKNLMQEVNSERMCGNITYKLLQDADRVFCVCVRYIILAEEINCKNIDQCKYGVVTAPYIVPDVTADIGFKYTPDK